MVALKDGRETTFTSGELVHKSQELWQNCFSKATGDAPVFMATDVESPLGFTSFLSCSSNFRKVFIPGTYNMSSLLKALPTQNSNYLVCDSEFYSLQAPP